MSKTELLHQVARDYVLNGLGEKRFESTPYDNDVILRAPLCPVDQQTP